MPPCSEVFQKHVVAQPVKKFVVSMGVEVPLPYSLELKTGLYSGPHKSGPQPYAISIRYVVILPYPL